MEGSFNRAGAAATKMAADAQKAAAATAGMGNTSRLAGHHMQNLAFQANDIAVSLAGGQKPMTVFMQQGSQIAQIMMQAGVGVGGLVRQVGAMGIAFLAANPLLLAAAAAAGAIAAGIGLMTEEINKSSKVQVTWTDTLLGSFDVIKTALADEITANFKAMGLDIGEVWEAVKRYTKSAINFMIAVTTAVPRMIMASYDKIPAAFGDAFYSAANVAIEALNRLARMSAAPLNLIIAGFNKAFGTQIPEIVIGGLEKIANPYAGAMSALGSAAAKSFVGSFTKDYIGDFADAVSTAAQNRARLRQAAEKGGKDVGSKAGKAAGKAAGEAFGENFAIELINSMAKYGMDVRKAMQPVVDAINAAQIDELTAKLRKAQDEATRAGREAAEASQQWNADLRDTVDLLDQIGGRATGLGNLLAGLYGARTGDFSGVPGPTGALLANLFTTRDQNGNRVLNKLGDEFRSALDSVFGGNGKFFQALQGATTGAAIGGILGGNQASQFGAMAGGALGQVFGEKFLSKGLSSIAKGLGDFAGPIGSIVGSLAGSLLGGIFKGGPSWSTTNLASGATGGNKDQQRGAVGQAVGAFDQALQQIAGQLGATVGDFNTSIGLHNGNWHVSTAGRIGTLRTTRGWSDVTDYGPNAQAALTAAIQDAISDGAFLGLSDGVKRIISGGGDLDTQLKKAVSFQSVFSELEKLKDPVGAAVKALDSEMTYLRSVFAEAGASAAEYAQLEELYQLKRKDIIEKANAEALDLERTRRTMEIQLMELTGNTVGALAAARQMELDALDPSLRALAQQIHAAQDMRTEADAAARAIEEASRKFGDLAKNLRDYALSLTGSAANGPMGYRSAQVEFMKQSALAQTGDQAGLAALQGASQAYLEVSRATSTAAQYQRDLGNVLASLDQAARVAESLASPGSATVTGTGTSGSLREVAVTITDGNASLKAEIAQLRSDLNAALLSIAQNTSSVDRTTKRWDRGNAVAVTADDPVPVASV
jgi:hypothetical protein